MPEKPSQPPALDPRLVALLGLIFLPYVAGAVVAGLERSPSATGSAAAIALALSGLTAAALLARGVAWARLRFVALVSAVLLSASPLLAPGMGAPLAAFATLLLPELGALYLWRHGKRSRE